MRWREGRRSTNVEDRRGVRVGRPAAIGGGGLLLGLVLVTALCGGDPTQLLQLLLEAQPPTVSVDGTGYEGSGTAYPQVGTAPEDELGQFVSAVLADTEDTWGHLFAQGGSRYPPPTLVMFSDAVQSACGFGSAAVGPFYCPADEKIYIDLGFYRELRDRFGAPGDFAQAYVIAHEVGHHVQNLLGLSGRVHELQRRARDQSEANALSVGLELQADCLAGVWGHHADAQRQMLERGDVEEGLRAAAAIGDDRIQRMSGDRVSPESWTHGSSAQRVSWFRRGLQTGSVDSCDPLDGQEY